MSYPGAVSLPLGAQDAPHLEVTFGQLSNALGLSEEEVTRIISREAFSIAVKSIPGIERYDGAQLAANSPCQDRYFHGQFECPDKTSDRWMSWAVLDGHSGPQTAELLRAWLLPMVHHSLQKLMPSASGSSVSEQAIQCAIVKAFLDLDRAIINIAEDTMKNEMPLAEKVTRLASAYAGSCALLTLWDPTTHMLRVACTGDSRAVLGRQNAEDNWEAHPLSVDQNGSNKDEIARIQHDHPGEEKLFLRDGRVLGLGVSRAFGDCRWKWSRSLQQEMKHHFSGPDSLVPKFDVKTPPYITAGPVVTSTKIDAIQPAFLIIATDGLWDFLSSQQAVTLVGKWLKLQGANLADDQTKPIYPPCSYSRTRKKFDERQTTTQDTNAAVHLLRNSLGGNHHELIAGQLALGAPFARSVRDDITVQVVFFNMPGL